MTEARFVEVDEFNGLGERLNQLDRNEAACQARTSERLDGMAKRQDSQSEDITKIFDSIDGIKALMNKGIGIMIAINGAVILFQLAAPYLFKH